MKLACRLNSLFLIMIVSTCGWHMESLAQESTSSKTFANTQPLEMTGDITSELVDAADRFLLKQLANVPQEREKNWGKLQGLSTAAPEVARRGVESQRLIGELNDPALRGTDQNEQARMELARIIGLRDARVPHPAFTVELAAGQALPPGSLRRVRWPVHEDLDAEGLLLERSEALFSAVIIPDADHLPVDLVGVGDNPKRALPLAKILHAMGGEVLVTTPISRHREARRGRAVMTDQEYLYRSAFELGRHVLGYQVQETLAAVDALRYLPPPKPVVPQDVSTPPDEVTVPGKKPILVFGWGEGGWVALHAAAISQRIDAVCVSGHFQARENMWQEPIHRNIHGLLQNFGDAELAAMIAPRKIVIDAVPGPEVNIAGEGGAPGKLSGPTVEAAKSEFARTKRILERKQLQPHAKLITAPSIADWQGPSLEAIDAMLEMARDLRPGAKTATRGDLALEVQRAVTAKPEPMHVFNSRETSRQSMLKKWDRFSQRRLEYAADERAEYWKELKTDSLDNFKSSVEPYRQAFTEDVIGRWNIPLAPPRPRSRLAYDTDKVTGYEIVMDLFEGHDLFAYGVLLMPKSKEPIQHRPCVVFQHGLEGRPQDCITGDHPAYHDVAMKLAEQGFVVFAPQNLYIFHDRFRTLQRKSNPLGKSLFSIINPSHQQICRWLGSLPEVDPSRIAFYGLSYGGKSAMRIPPVVPEYCLSICSADFNDWVWKNASTHAPHSYVWTMEYEIFEFDLGSRFNYAEMAALIAPRPFMVERGHFDGVAPDDRVAAEFAKVRNLYSARLKLENTVQLEWFVGPHTINGKGTYQFLHEKLK